MIQFYNLWLRLWLWLLLRLGLWGEFIKHFSEKFTLLLKHLHVELVLIFLHGGDKGDECVGIIVIRFLA